MLDALAWIVAGIVTSVWNLGYALSHPGLWLDWPDGAALMRFIYYGASSELLFVVLTALLVLTGVGLWRNAVLWGSVRVLEGFANTVGRVVAWAGLLMVLQQIVIIFAQRVFAASSLVFGFGSVISFDISWWSRS